jgi:cation diffusion facilitator CzcD-associated flavoprotein CzcO
MMPLEAERTNTMSQAPAAGLAALEARLRHDLACLNYPPANWVPQRRHAGREVVDVVLIGGGMCGLAAAFSLLRLGIRNLRILDRSAAGREGPWITYARMETLRSPKHLTGPAADIPALTFRAWYEAQFGQEAWERLGKILRPMWMQYLSWYRQVLDLRVENGIEVLRIEPAEAGLLRLPLKGAAESEILARKVVLATGREGLGDPYIPDFVKDLPRRRWAHSADPIDFAALRGRRVVVIGVGASAVDNAAEALEAGAAEVRLLIRRQAMPRINKLMGIGTPGFTHGFPALPDLWRWRFMHYAHDEQTPPPRESTLRVSRHPNASFHFGCGIRTMSMAGDAVRIDTVGGKLFEADFVILGTGFTVDHRARPELAGFAEAIATWRDRFTPPAGLESAELAGFPYLAPDFAFTEREPGEAPWLKNIHCFNHAATLSLGKISGDIPAVSDGAAMLARAIAAAFYREDVEIHYGDLLAYGKPELLGDEWTDAG